MKNYDANNVVFSHNGVNYMEFRADTGTIETPNNDAIIKIGVSLESSQNLVAQQGFTGTVLRNNDGLNAPSFNHLANEYMKYEDVNLNPTTPGLKILDTLYSQDIIPSQIKMVYNNENIISR